MSGGALSHLIGTRLFLVRMLVFWKGAWHDVVLPEFTDPSWSAIQCQRFAVALLKGRAIGQQDLDILKALEASNPSETA